jgi:hypothetical protein
MNGKFTIGELQDYYHCIWIQKFKNDADEAQKDYRRLYQPQYEKERKRVSALICGDQQLSITSPSSSRNHLFVSAPVSTSSHHRHHHRSRSEEGSERKGGNKGKISTLSSLPSSTSLHGSSSSQRKK